MTTTTEQLKLVRTRNRKLIEEGTYQKFLFQTVWSFSPDGINTETYVVSAVVSVENESTCETFVFPATDENGDDFYGLEVWSSPHFMGHHNDHKLLLGEYLRRCAQEQRNEARETLEKFENLFSTP